VAEIDDLEEARQVIRDHISEVEVAVQEVMEQEGKVQDFSVKFDRVDFPTKLYGPYLYPAGEYEALLITIGEGKGANWWCVLFPPLCFLDFANGTSINPVEAYPERELSTKVKVKFLALEWYSKFFG